jgi:thioredoxin-like negative regulator of GroEL
MLNTQNFNDFINQKNAVVFFHKTGCSNCTQMKPVFEEFKKNNPDVACEEYLCTAPDEVTKQYQFKTFPAIYIFQNGQQIGHTEGIASYNTLQYPFLSDTQLKSLYFDFLEAIEQASIMQKDAQFIKQILTVRKNMPVVENVPVPTKAIDLSGFPEGQSPEDAGCEGCGSSDQ